MKKTILVLIALVALATLAYIGWQKNSARQQSSLDTPLISISDRVNDLQVIEITHKQEVTTLEKRDDQWLRTESDDFPVDVARIRSMMISFLDSKLLEAKTSTASRFDKLGLDAQSRTQVRGYYDSEKQQQAFFLATGNTNGDVGTYVLVDNEEQAWLASGRLQPQVDAADWLQTEILSIDKEDIVTIEIHHKGKKKITLQRDKNNNIVLKGLGNKEKMNSYALERLTRTLGGLELADVKKQTDVDVKETLSLQTQTDRGLVLDVTVFAEQPNDQNTYFASFIVRLDEGLIQLDNTSDTVEAIAQETQSSLTELAQKMDSRIFQLPDRIATVLTYERTDLVEKVEN